MLVTLSDMQLNFPNGTTETLLGSGFLSACIVPDFPDLMTIPLVNWKSVRRLRMRSLSTEGGSRSPNIHEVAKD